MKPPDPQSQSLARTAISMMLKDCSNSGHLQRAMPITGFHEASPEVFLAIISGLLFSLCLSCFCFFTFGIFPESTSQSACHVQFNLGSWCVNKQTNWKQTKLKLKQTRPEHNPQETWKRLLKDCKDKRTREVSGRMYPNNFLNHSFIISSITKLKYYNKNWKPLSLEYAVFISRN